MRAHCRASGPRSGAPSPFPDALAAPRDLPTHRHQAPATRAPLGLPSGSRCSHTCTGTSTHSTRKNRSGPARALSTSACSIRVVIARAQTFYIFMPPSKAELKCAGSRCSHTCTDLNTIGAGCASSRCGRALTLSGGAIRVCECVARRVTFSAMPPPSKRKKQVNRLPHVSAARQGSLRVEQSIVCSPCKKAKLCPSANRTHEFSCRATHTRREDPAAVQLRHQCERPCAPDLACLGVGRRFGLSTVVV